MKQKKVFLLSGVPGSGKSTWIIKQMKALTDLLISRDNIRFMLVKEDEPYFSRENEVIEIFNNAIWNATNNEDEIENIFIDATHLTKAARAKATFWVNRDNVELNCVCFKIPKAVCKERNAQRTGRACVPETVIDKMFQSFTIPTKEERFDHVYTVDENGVMEEVKYE